MSVSPLAKRFARARRRVEVAVLQHADRELAADRAPFFVLPDHHLERMTEADRLLAERLRDFDGGERADGAVVVAAVGDRVDVRPDEDRGQGRIASFDPREDVAGCIEPRREPRLSEEIERERPAAEVGLGVGDTVDAAGRPPDGIEPGEPAVQAIAVDPQRRSAVLAGNQRRRCERAGPGKKTSTVHEQC